MPTFLALTFECDIGRCCPSNDGQPTYLEISVAIAATLPGLEAALKTLPTGWTRDVDEKLVCDVCNLLDRVAARHRPNAPAANKRRT